MLVARMATPAMGSVSLHWRRSCSGSPGQRQHESSHAVTCWQAAYWATESPLCRGSIRAL